MSEAPFRHVAYTFPMFGYGFDLNGLDYAIGELKSITDTVQINPIFQQKTIHSNSFLAPGVNPYPGKPNMTPSDSDIKFIIKKFAHAGLDIELKIGANVADDTWSGLIDPSKPAVWFQNYGDILVKWAAYAQQFGCERLIITNEMWTLTSQYAHHWSTLIARVRDVFDGKIGVNAVVTPDEARNISFGNELDFIGLSFYAKLTDKTDPTVADLVAGWRNDVDGVDWVQRITDIHEQYDLPIEISEIAFFGYDGAAANGNFANASGAVDQAEQRDQYEAFFRVISNMPARWFEGVSFWRWIDTYPDSPWVLADPFEGPTGSHIDGKPAETTVREWLSGLRQTTGLDLKAVAGGGVLDGGYNHDTLLGSDGIDEIYGGPGKDQLTGLSGNDQLYGGTGNDLLHGGGGHDILSGDAGDDLLKGGSGSDVLRGGVGKDVLIGGPGSDRLIGGDNDDVLHGDDGKDGLVGGEGNDKLVGGGNVDVLRGGGGEDILIGGPGNDKLVGNGNDDVLRGGGGEDILIGGPKNDTLYGNVGGDRFVFTPHSGVDSIKDFEDGIDSLDLTAFGFATVKEARSIASNVNGNVVFDFAGGDVLIVEDVTKAQLTGEDIVL